MVESEYIEKNEALEILGISFRQLQRVVSRGLIRSEKAKFNPGRRGAKILYNGEDVHEYANELLNKDDFVPVKKASEECGTSVQTIYTAVNSGGLRHKRLKKPLRSKVSLLVYLPDCLSLYQEEEAVEIAGDLLEDLGDIFGDQNRV